VPTAHTIVKKQKEKTQKDKPALSKINVVAPSAPNLAIAQ
jgi:hypothetical protein